MRLIRLMMTESAARPGRQPERRSTLTKARCSADIRDSWVLGHLVKTSLRLAKVGHSVFESPVINPGTLSRSMISIPLDQKTAPLFGSSKAYLLVGGMNDLGIHLVLWMYQVSDFLALQAAKSDLEPPLA